MEWETRHPGATDHASIHRRRLGDGVRYSLERATNFRQMATRGSTSTYQCQGTTSHREDLSSHLGSRSISFTAIHGQHQCDCEHQEVWRDTIRSTKQHSHEDMEVLFSTLDSTINSICSFQAEPSGCSVTGASLSNRMATSTDTIPTTRSSVGTPLSGSFCVQSKSPSPLLCDMVVLPSSPEHQCSELGLDIAPGQTFHQSTVEPIIVDCAEVTDHPKSSDSDHCQLANSSVVSTTHATNEDTSGSSGHSQRSFSKRSRASEEESNVVPASMECTPSSPNGLHFPIAN